MYLSKSSASLNKLKRRKKNRWLRILRYWYVRILRLQDSPEAIARGIACGVFAGSFPFFGFQTLVGIALAILLRGNKITAAAGTWISNPFTYVPIFAFNYQIGCLLLKRDPSAPLPDLQAVSDIVELAKDKGLILFSGSAVVGIILAVLFYFLSLKGIYRWRKSRQFNYYQKNLEYSDRTNFKVLQGSSSDRD